MKPVRWVSIEIAEFPDGSIGPLAAQILLGFTFQFEEVRAEVVSVGQVPHDVEQPIAHAPRKVHHLISCAFLSDRNRIVDYSICSISLFQIFQIFSKFFKLF